MQPGLSWELPHLCGERSALALCERVSILSARFIAGNGRSLAARYESSCRLSWLPLIVRGRLLFLLQVLLLLCVLHFHLRGLLLVNLLRLLLSGLVRVLLG
jgi:hypothetical protein